MPSLLPPEEACLWRIRCNGAGRGCGEELLGAAVSREGDKAPDPLSVIRDVTVVLAQMKKSNNEEDGTQKRGKRHEHENKQKNRP